MLGLLADVNVDAHVEALVRYCKGPRWVEFWDALGVTWHTFDDVGLDRQTKDDAVWTFCQQRSLVLLTNNRNDDGDDSLTAAIRRLNTNSSLPVFTFANGDRILRDRLYAEAVAIRMMELLDDIDQLRGRGRVFLP